jgi:hypothetical protein
VRLPSSCFARTIGDEAHQVNAQIGHDRHQNGHFDPCAPALPHADVQEEEEAYQN